MFYGGMASADQETKPSHAYRWIMNALQQSGIENIVAKGEIAHLCRIFKVIFCRFVVCGKELKTTHQVISEGSGFAMATHRDYYT